MISTHRYIIRSKSMLSNTIYTLFYAYKRTTAYIPSHQERDLALFKLLRKLLILYVGCEKAYNVIGERRCCMHQR